MTIFMNTNLQISHYLTHSTVNGPGKRFTIWLQGCDFNCKGCFNPELQPHHGGEEHTPEEIFDLIMASKATINGVTFSGGEPFLQAKALLPLAKLLKSAEINLLIYTGYKLQELIDSQDKDKRDLLDLVDILIDGRYEENMPATSIYAGSGNQHIYVFNPSRPEETEIEITGHFTEVLISPGGNIFMTGFPDHYLQNILKNEKELL